MGAHESPDIHLETLLVNVVLVVDDSLVEETEASNDLAVRELSGDRGLNLRRCRLHSALLQLDHGIAPHNGLLVCHGAYILDGLLWVSEERRVSCVLRWLYELNRLRRHCEFPHCLQVLVPFGNRRAVELVKPPPLDVRAVAVLNGVVNLPGNLLLRRVEDVLHRRLRLG